MWLLLAMASAQEVSGFVELRGAAVVGADGAPVQAVERFRPTFEAPLSDRVSLSTTIEAALAQGRDTHTVLRQTLESSELGPLLEECEWPSYDNALFRTNDSGDYFIVDRLYLDWYHPKFDLRIGRQALQWGSGQFINPTDPFPQVLFAQPWLPRAGVNSARITVPVGDVHQVQGVVGMDDDFQAVRVATRATANWKQTDWSLVGVWRQENDEALVGVDIKGTAGVGFWVEGGLRMQELSGDVALSEQVVVGVDYSFAVLQSLIVSVQYIRNGGTHDAALAGLGGTLGPDCGEDSPFGDSSEPDPFAPFLTGRDYGMLSAGVGIVPEVNASATWLQNIGDGSGFIVPSLSIAAPRQIDISASAQIPVATWGNGEFKPSDDDLMLGLPGASADLSGLVPDASFFLWTRLNF